MKYKILFPLFIIFSSLAAHSQTRPSADTVNISNDRDLIFTRTEIPPSFPGGEAGWQTYITKHIKSNIDNLVNDNKSGTCRVKFIVDKDGSVSAINALTMKGSVLAEVATNAIANGPKWIPAKQNGRVVKSFAEQPVTFTIQTK